MENRLGDAMKIIVRLKAPAPGRRKVPDFAGLGIDLGETPYAWAPISEDLAEVVIDDAEIIRRVFRRVV